MFDHAGLAVASGLAPNSVYSVYGWDTDTQASIYDNADRDNTLSSYAATDAIGGTSFYSEPGTVALRLTGGSTNQPPIAVTVPINPLDVASNGLSATITTTTGAYAMTGSEQVILADDAVTLPDPADFSGTPYTIKDSGGGTASLLPNDAETIDGAASVPFTDDYEGVTVSSDGTNWWVIAQVATAIL